MKRLASATFALIIAVAGMGLSTTTAVAEPAGVVKASGELVRKEKRISGDFTLIERDGKRFIVLSDDFRAANGPDLKVFLSPQSVASVNGKTAINGAVLLGELKSTSGRQEYEIPAGLDLSAFESVLVHCEAYAVLWGGGDL